MKFIESSKIGGTVFFALLGYLKTVCQKNLLIKGSCNFFATANIPQLSFRLTNYFRSGLAVPSRGGFLHVLVICQAVILLAAVLCDVRLPAGMSAPCPRAAWAGL